MSAKRVVIFGANGKVGKQLCHKLKAASALEPLAVVRKEEQVKAFEQQGIKSVLASLTGDLRSIVDVVKGNDVVVFTAGAGGASDALTMMIDLDGAVKTMEAAEMAHVKRYIMVSAIKADERDYWSKSEALRVYYTAKHYADRELQHTNLDWTILQPGLLTDNAATKKIEPVNLPLHGSAPRSINREDVAECIIEAINQPKTIHKSLQLLNGELPIAKVFAEL
ncbi:hypothetical protein TRVA0_006S00254 [Trichomonascus vanleenenianus]|uniref:uncharacterized protein n=1 Tax=Trichomonascus vanleenenianus TaxID=2268995 RepID=UPI003ECAD942